MISVCLACYNGEKYIEEQLRSILVQLGDHDEVIISDDGSSDSTIEIIRSFRDPRIRILSNPGPDHGVNANFNNALSNARGDIIFLSDQDDVWLPGKVQNCLDALENADLVVHDAIITDYTLKPYNKTLFSELNIKKGFVNNLVKNRFTGCCMAFKSGMLKYMLPIPVCKSFFHDNWIGLICELKGNVSFIESAEIYFRRHPDSKSLAGKGIGLSLLNKLKSRIGLIFLLLKRSLAY